MIKTKYIFIIPFLLLLCLSLPGQENKYKFGIISDWEKALVTYEKDHDAEAVVLFDLGDTRFIKTDNGLDLLFERTRRIKILSEAGMSNAEVEILLYREGSIYEVIKEIKAYTHNYENGIHTVTKLDPKTCYTEEINESWSNMKFAFPDVKVGSIIEYTYKLESEYIFNLRDWEFQSDIPTIFSQYTTRMVPFYEYKYILKGANQFDIFETKLERGIPRYFAGIEYYDNVYKFGMRDVPALHIEEYTSSRNDIVMTIDFQLAQVNRTDGSKTTIISTWRELSKELLKHQSFGKYIQKAKSGAKNIVDKEALEGMTEIDKVKYIVSTIKENYTWDGNYGKYANSKFNDFLKSKHGNTGDINLTLIGVLQSAGIESNPLILSTRDHGKVYLEYPFSHFLNYVVAQVNIEDKIILIDATEPNADFDLIPTRCINGKGLSVVKDNPEWFYISFSKPSGEQVHIETHFDNENENFFSEVKIITNSYDALRMRNNFGKNTEQASESYDTDLLETFKDSTKIENFDNKDKPYVINLYQRGKAEYIGNKIYVSPFLDMVRKENPFKHTSRTYPIEMIYPYTEIYIATIHIPEGYKIDYLPEPLSYRNSQYSLDFRIIADKEKVSASFSFSFNKDTYPASDYLKLKGHFQSIINCGQEKIVFIEE